MYIITVKGKEVSRHEKEQDARSEWHRLRPKYGMDVKVRKESKSPYMSQASKMDRYKASKDYLKIKTQQSTLPRIDKARYHQRKGLEGPFMTKSGQVIYYDKKFGKYYNSDTDMYIDHDDWKKMSEELEEGTWHIAKDMAPLIHAMKRGPMRIGHTRFGTAIVQKYIGDDELWDDFEALTKGDDMRPAIRKAMKRLGIKEDAPANATGTAVAGTGDDSSTVVVKKKKSLQDKLMKRMGIKETIDRTIPDLEYPKDEITERKQQLIDMARKYGENI